MSDKIVLSMKNISKSFPGVKALSNVDFTLREGEIHALMGENGAGKSTLIKVLTGVYGFEEGQIVMEGNRTIVNNSPQDAQKNGISTVYQEVNLCPNLTVAENLFIGREPRKCGMIDWRTMNRKSAEVLKSLDINVSPTQNLDPEPDGPITTTISPFSMFMSIPSRTLLSPKLFCKLMTSITLPSPPCP